MLVVTRHHTRARRGVVLILVLAMLGLLALIGVTFATFSGQARINARQLRAVSHDAAGRRADGLRPPAVDQRHQRPPLGDPRPQPGARHVRQRRVQQRLSRGQPAHRPAFADRPQRLQAVHSPRGRRLLRRADATPRPRQLPGDVRLQLHAVDHAGHLGGRRRRPAASPSPSPSRSWSTTSRPARRTRSSAATACTPSASARSTTRWPPRSSTTRRSIGRRPTATQPSWRSISHSIRATWATSPTPSTAAGCTPSTDRGWRRSPRPCPTPIPISTTCRSRWGPTAISASTAACWPATRSWR